MRGQPDIAQIQSTLRQHLPSLAQRFGVCSLSLFGSYVRRENRPDSDLDVLVSFSRAPSLLHFIELENYLTDLLGIKVDLVMRDALKPGIGQRILAEIVPI
jgi:predicted nucleotidyltransferase